MKRLLRSYLINLGALWLTTQAIPGLFYEGGAKTLALGGLAVMLINFIVVPLLKLLFLPFNLITFGLFSWVINVFAIYVLVTVIPQFKLMPYNFPGLSLGFVTVPEMMLNTLYVAIGASLLISLSSNLAKWLVK